MRYSILVVMLLMSVLGSARAQTRPAVSAAGEPPPTARVYRCGNQYTNDATDAQARGCKLLEGASVTVVQGARGGPATQRPGAVSGGAAASSLKVDGADQRARDADARAILETELRKALSTQAELVQEYNNGEPEKLGPETRNYQKYLDRVAALRASISRNDQDIHGLRRELSRLTASK